MNNTTPSKTEPSKRLQYPDAQATFNLMTYAAETIRLLIEAHREISDNDNAYSDNDRKYVDLDDAEAFSAVLWERGNGTTQDIESMYPPETPRLVSAQEWMRLIAPYSPQVDLVIYSETKETILPYDTNSKASHGDISAIITDTLRALGYSAKEATTALRAKLNRITYVCTEFDEVEELLEEN